MDFCEGGEAKFYTFTMVDRKEEEERGRKGGGSNATWHQRGRQTGERHAPSKREEDMLGRHATWLESKPAPSLLKVSCKCFTKQTLSCLIKADLQVLNRSYNLVADLQVLLSKDAPGC